LKDSVKPLENYTYAKCLEISKIVPLSSFPIGKSPWKGFEISTYTVPLSPSQLDNLHGDDLGFSRSQYPYPSPMKNLHGYDLRFPPYYICSFTSISSLTIN
jgi:hypothetical protein